MMGKIVAYKNKCKLCGKCCKTEVCLVGKVILGTTKTPCPALIKKTDKHWCGLVTNPQAYKYLGISLSVEQCYLVQEHLMIIFNYGEGCDLEEWRIDG